MQEPKKSHRVVYAIIDRPKTGKKFWVRVGAAFTNRDGSVNVQLDAIPISGQLQIRDARLFELPETRDSNRDRISNGASRGADTLLAGAREAAS
jgi:hypothetical protein